jgi:hypothetical protein
MHALSKVYLVAASLVFANSLTFASSPTSNSVPLAVRGPASHLQLIRGISASGLNLQGRIIRTWTLLKPVVRQTPNCVAQNTQHLFLCPSISSGSDDWENPAADNSKGTPGADFEAIDACFESLKRLPLQEGSQWLGEGTDRKPFPESPMMFQEFAALNQALSRNLFSEFTAQ